MGFLDRIAVRWAWLFVGLAIAGCPGADGTGHFPAHGTVEDVDTEMGQVLVDHDDVEGLMPAMTMNFAVRDRDLLEALAPGQVIDFTIHFTGRSYEIVEVEVVGEAAIEDGWFRLREGLVRTSPAPPFDLIDHEGRPVSLASLSDRVLLVDFIYTSCPGPCPVQTSNQVAIQKRIPAPLAEGIHFVSISLDPANDTPSVLKRYALERGADLETWSFLTGPADVLAELVRKWGVGSLRREDGSIDHTLITFLVSEGQVVQHYTPSDGDADRVVADVVALAKERGAS